MERPRLHLVTAPSGQDVDGEDAALCRGLLEDRPGAGEELWRRYAPLVRRILMRTLGPDRDCEDLVQDTFLTLFRKLSALRKHESLRSFLTSIAVFTARGALRSRWIRRCMFLSSDGNVPEVAVGAADFEGREALSRFYRLLDDLRPRDRSIFVLRYLEGLTLGEVAAAVGISMATVKRRIPHVQKRIASLVAHHGDLVALLGRLEGSA